MNEFVRNPNRGAPQGTLILGVLILVGHHMFVDQLPGAVKLLVVLGTLFVSLGLGGLVDPRFFTGVMDEAKGVYPKWVRMVSGGLVAVGFITGGLLLIFVYRKIPLP